MIKHQHGNQQFTCPMHPEVVKEEPGKCPKCGMDLVPVIKSGHSHEGHVQEQTHDHHQMHKEHSHRADKHNRMHFQIIR